MAILQMKRLTLAVTRDHKDALMKELIRHGCVEVSEIGDEISASEISSLVKSENSDIQRYRQGYATLLHGVELLDRYVPKRTKMLAPKPEVDSDALLDETGMWGAVGFARQIEENDAKIKRIIAEESRQRSVIDSLKPWLGLTVPLNTGGTEYAGDDSTLPLWICLMVMSAAAGVLVVTKRKESVQENFK